MRRSSSPLRQIGVAIQSICLTRFRTVWSVLCLAFLPLFLVFLLFGSLFWGNGVFAFRDVAHFYHPLDAWIDSIRHEGGSLAWNPYENGGQPLDAIATSAVYYPPKALRILIRDPFIADAIYLVGHLLLAVVTTWRLGRQFGRSCSAALWGGLAYAFGGCVLFQYANPPFLVGAAWMPEALLRIDRLIRRVRRRDLCGAIAAVSMMILGGDPQAAYHTALIVPLLLAATMLARDCRLPSRRVLARLTTIPAVFLVAALLAAVQVLPAMEVTRLSDRTLYPEAMHYQVLYHYSVPPIRILELFFPNVGGTMFPLNSRWIGYFEPNTWTPTLFMGTLTTILAIVSLRYLPRHRGRYSFRDRGSLFFSWLATFALMAAFGQFGLGWLLDQFGRHEAAMALPGYGCLYGMLLNIPGYVSFRYPAKWLPVFALAMAMLGARGFDRLLRDVRFRVRMIYGIRLLLLLLVAALVVLFFFTVPIPRQLAPSPLFGPYLPELAAGWVRLSVLQSCGFLLLTLYALSVVRRRNHQAALLLILLAGDLWMANAWTIATCSHDAFQATSTVYDVIAQEASAANRPIRVYRCPLWYPPSFSESSSINRLEEAVRWDVATLWPKYHLLYALPIEGSPHAGQTGHPIIALLDVRGTMMSGEHFLITEAIRRSWYAGNADFEERVVALGAEWVIAPANRPLHPDWAERQGDVETLPENTAVWRIRSPITPQDDAARIFQHVPALRRMGGWITLGTLFLLPVTLWGIGQHSMFRVRNKNERSISSA